MHSVGVAAWRLEHLPLICRQAGSWHGRGWDSVLCTVGGEGGHAADGHDAHQPAVLVRYQVYRAVVLHRTTAVTDVCVTLLMKVLVCSAQTSCVADAARCARKRCVLRLTGKWMVEGSSAWGPASGGTCNEKQDCCKCALLFKESQ